MGLSGREREGCNRVLSFLDDTVLRSLAKTVKSGKMTCKKEGIIEAILDHSQSAEELLKRRKVYYDSISKYLSSEDLDVLPRSSKSDVIQIAIRHWAGTVSSTRSSHNNRSGQRVEISEQTVTLKIATSSPTEFLSVNLVHPPQYKWPGHGNSSQGQQGQVSSTRSSHNNRSGQRVEISEQTVTLKIATSSPTEFLSVNLVHPPQYKWPGHGNSSQEQQGQVSNALSSRNDWSGQIPSISLGEGSQTVESSRQILTIEVATSSPTEILSAKLVHPSQYEWPGQGNPSQGQQGQGWEDNTASLPHSSLSAAREYQQLADGSTPPRSRSVVQSYTQHPSSSTLNDVITEIGAIETVCQAHQGNQPRCAH
ncbi:uncharacterized protein LOC142139445 isoform X2 [Mixophyes fleayi]|uniref:uncharacterized protein LOC142139445 isoform X2 n=1 Tax=Mixophyes fleayi TaxID=3061075 RepID=UPI003F4D8FC7